MVCSSYNKDSLCEFFKDKNNNLVDLSSVTIDECIKFAGEKGWTVRKVRKADKEDILVNYNGSLKKVVNGSGFVVILGNKNKTVKAYMDEKLDAFLVCILEILK